jgi:hypothetical protein
LHVKLAHGRAVVHGVEGGDLVDAHGGHLEEAGDFVHDADRGEAVLALAEVEEGHDGGFFVLRRVALEDLGDDGLVGGGELEGHVGVVVGGVAVLWAVSLEAVLWEGPWFTLTTMRVSLRRCADSERARNWGCCGRDARHADRTTVRRSGVSLLAMAGAGVEQLIAGESVVAGSKRSSRSFLARSSAALEQCRRRRRPLRKLGPGRLL